MSALILYMVYPFGTGRKDILFSLCIIILLQDFLAIIISLCENVQSFTA